MAATALPADVWKKVVALGTPKDYSQFVATCRMMANGDDVGDWLFREILEHTAAVYQLPFMRQPIDYKALYRRFYRRGVLFSVDISSTRVKEDVSTCRSACRRGSNRRRLSTIMCGVWS